MERRRSRVVRQGQRQHHEDLQAGDWMTATVEPNPEATRPELTEHGEGGRAPSLLGGRYGTTSLGVGAAWIWLSIIVLLPLAAIVWQSAGGGWRAFWHAVSSNAALESFRVTLTISA